MDSKALMRSRVRDAVRSREKKLNTPLVRYNDVGQPVCKICDINVKSESLWNAHTSSRQHRTAVEDFKAKAAAAARGPPPSEQPRVPVSTAVPRARPASALPEDFFDARPNASSAAAPESGRPKTKPRISDERVDARLSIQKSIEEPKQNPPTGSLPTGFFDNKDADSRARGIEPVKINIQDEYEQFRKSIVEDVKDVDVRLDNEEGEAAETREELEQIVQSKILERIEAIKKRKLEKAVVVAKSKKTQFHISEEDETSDESDEDNLELDWRAKHI